MGWLSAPLWSWGAVLMLQYGYGYAPCKLCLTERLPFYAALPLGLAALFRARALGPAWRSGSRP